MNKPSFKEKQKTKSENKTIITKEFLNSFSMEHEYSPVQLMENEQPVKLIRCSAGYWVMLEFGEYLKDEKNRLIVIPEKEAKIGRARYLLNYAAEIEAVKIDKLEKAIQAEIDVLKAKVDDKLDADIKKIREILVLAGKIEVDGLERILMDAVGNASGNDPYGFNNNDRLRMEERKKLAKELATDDLMSSYNLLLKYKINTPYNQLYTHFFQDGVPMIGSFKIASSSDIHALKALFNADLIMDTIEEIKEKDHLYMVAKVNVEKRLAKP